jgi:hypothetical protein
MFNIWFISGTFMAFADTCLLKRCPRSWSSWPPMLTASVTVKASLKKTANHKVCQAMHLLCLLPWITMKVRECLRWILNEWNNVEVAGNNIKFKRESLSSQSRYVTAYKPYATNSNINKCAITASLTMRHNNLHNPYLASLNCVQTQLAEAFHSGLKRNFPEPACQTHILSSKMVSKICMRHTLKHSGFLHQKNFPLWTQQNTADIWWELRILKNRLQTFELRSESNVPTDQRFLTFSSRHTLGLNVRRHEPPLNALNLVVYYQNDKMHFKQTVFSSGTVRVTQGRWHAC